MLDLYDAQPQFSISHNQFIGYPYILFLVFSSLQMHKNITQYPAYGKSSLQEVRVNKNTHTYTPII